MQAGRKPLDAGQRLAGFTVIGELGEGGMGVVYLARDEQLGRKVALKVIAPHLAHDSEFQRRFEAEAKNAAAIEHTNAVPVYTAGAADGRLFIAMRYVEGTDLRRALAESGPLEVGAAVRVLAEVAGALDAAHAAGLVHRDVKPANVLLTGAPGAGTSYLTDFGLTRDLSGAATQLTATGRWIGTLDYVAPEQMAGGRIDARTDIYALGCVLYEMLAGAVPFPGDEMRKLWSKANEDTPPLPASGGRPHPLDPVIGRATARDPDRRFRSAGDLARAAAAASGAGGEAPTERSVATGAAAVGLAESAEAATARMPRPTPPPRQPPTVPPPPVRGGGTRSGWSRGRSAATVLGALALAAGLVVAALLATNPGGGRSRPATAGGGSKSQSASARPTGAPQKEAEQPSASSSAVSSEPTLFEGGRYSVALPAGWVQIEREQTASDGSYVENKWRSPDGSEEILIDDSAGEPADPAASARAITADVRDAGETVYADADGVVHGGIEGSELDFRADSGLPERADFFFDLGDTGFAVLSTGYDLARAQDRIGPVVSSLHLSP